jgi:hypothetical protein
VLTVLCAVAQVGSPHPGICQFSDGTVRPISNSITPAVLGLLAQRNDGQAVSLD